MIEMAPKNLTVKVNESRLVDSGEKREFGIRFSSDTHLVRMREEFVKALKPIR